MRSMSGRALPVKRITQGSASAFRHAPEFAHKPEAVLTGQFEVADHSIVVEPLASKPECLGGGSGAGDTRPVEFEEGAQTGLGVRIVFDHQDRHPSDSGLDVWIYVHACVSPPAAVALG